VNTYNGVPLIADPTAGIIKRWLRKFAMTNEKYLNKMAKAAKDCLNNTDTLYRWQFERKDDIGLKDKIILKDGDNIVTAWDIVVWNAELSHGYNQDSIGYVNDLKINFTNDNSNIDMNKIDKNIPFRAFNGDRSTVHKQWALNWCDTMKNDYRLNVDMKIIENSGDIKFILPWIFEENTEILKQNMQLLNH